MPLRLRGYLLRALSAACLLPALCAGASADGNTISIGTGRVTGVYYVIGKEVCFLINQMRQQAGPRCTVEATPGSLYNRKEVLEGTLDVAMLQADVAAAMPGSGDVRLTRLFATHQDLLTLVVKRGAGIASVADLAGRRVSVGNFGSGTLETWKAVSPLLLPGAGTVRASHFSPSEQAQRLCDGVVDAFFFVAGHPNRSVREAMTSCEASFLPLTGPAIDTLVSRHDYYRTAAMDVAPYALNGPAVQTMGVTAVMVTRSSMPAERVRFVLQQVFGSLTTLRRAHQALAGITPERMVGEGRAIPLHPAAAAFYAERGLR